MANKINGNDVPQPLPCPPFHNITGLDNFRDIGGYVSSIRSSSGALQQVRRGIVFRSADPSHVVDEGIAAMAALGISTVYDLRSGPEVSKPGKVKEWAGAKRVFLPVFLDEDYSPEAIAHRFKNYASKGSEVSTNGPKISINMNSTIMLFQIHGICRFGECVSPKVWICYYLCTLMFGIFDLPNTSLKSRSNLSHPVCFFF